MKRWIAVIAALILLSVCAVSLGESLYVDNRETDKVHPERLNMRTEPSKNGAILGLYYTGAQVNALETEGEYTKVEIGGVSGYMMTEYLITLEEAQARYGADSGFGDCRTAKVDLSGMGAKASLYQEADDYSETLLSLEQGTIVSLIGILGDDWAYVSAQAENGAVQGYLPLDMLVDAAEHEAMIVAGSDADTRTILYSAPNDKAAEIMSIKNGAACFSLFGRKEGNWVKVRVGGVSGWIRYTQADNLKPIGQSDLRSTVPYYPLVMQTKNDALLYSVKGDTSNAYQTIGRETRVEVYAEDGDYVYVRTLMGDAGSYDCGDYGYMALSDLSLAEAEGAFAVAQADDDDLPVLIMDAPEADAKMIGAMIAGAQVRIIDFTQSDYIKIALGDVTGYVLKSQIRALGDGSAKPSERIPQRAYVNGGATLLNKPGGKGDTEIGHDSRVYMLAVCGDHAYVQADTKFGFEDGAVTMGFIPLSKLDAPASTTHLTAFVTEDKINMRESDSRNSEIVARARLDERLRVADYGQEWTCIVTPAGKRGYVMTQYLDFE